MGHENEAPAPGSDPTAGSGPTDQHHAWVSAFTGIDTRAHAHRPHRHEAPSENNPPPDVADPPPPAAQGTSETVTVDRTRAGAAAADRFDRLRSN